MHKPDVVVEFNPSDLLAGKGGGDSDRGSQKRNGPAERDNADVVNAGVVVGLGLSARTGTRHVDAGRRLHVDGLMGPLFVEAGLERVESFLLAAQQMGRRPGRLQGMAAQQSD